MEYDVNELSNKLNILETGRQESLTKIEELNKRLLSIKENKGQQFTSDDLVEQEKINKENAKVIRAMKKEQKRYDEIFEAQIELGTIRNNMYEEILAMNNKIASLRKEINHINLTILPKLEGVSGSELAKESIEKLKQDKITELEDLEFKKSLYFDKTKNKENIEDKESTEDKENTEGKEESNFKDDFNKAINNIVDGNATKEEALQKTSSENDSNENDKNVGTEKDEQNIDPVPAKKPVLIKNIKDYFAKHSGAIAKGVVAIASLTALTMLGLGAVGIGSALGVTVGDAAAAYIAGKSTFGKGK